MADHHNDDLTASKTEGFKVGEKKTIEEYKQLGMSMSVNSRTCICSLPFPLPMHPVTPVRTIPAYTHSKSFFPSEFSI